MWLVSLSASKLSRESDLVSLSESQFFGETTVLKFEVVFFSYWRYNDTEHAAAVRGQICAEKEAKLWESTLTFSVTGMLGLILQGNIVLRLKVAHSGRGAPLTLSLSLIRNVNISCLSGAN